MLDRRALLAGLALLTAPARAQTRPSLFGPHPDYEALGWFDRNARQSSRLHRARNAICHHATDGIERITIARLDLDKAWLHVPALRVAFETDLTGLGLAPAILRGGGFRETAVRTATVDGVPATQLRVQRDGGGVSFDALALVDRRGVLWQIEGIGAIGGNGGRLDWRLRGRADWRRRSFAVRSPSSPNCPCRRRNPACHAPAVRVGEVGALARQDRYLLSYSSMIRTIRHKGLRRLFEAGDAKGVPADRRDKIAKLLHRLHWSKTIDDMNLPGLRLHPLKGELRGFWAVDVSANWRIVFRFEAGEAADVDLIDCH